MGLKLKTGVGLICLLACFVVWAHGQDLIDDSLTAKKRLFPSVGPGLRAVKRGPGGNYYILTAPGYSVGVFDAAGKELRRIPEENKNPQAVQAPGIVYGEDMDVDAQGTVYVADRGANLVKIWNAAGNERTVRVNAPVSIAALPDGEVAVAALHEQHLVVVYDKNGRDVREFGDPEPISERAELNRFLSTGILISDPSGHLYYAFPYLPESTVRQYDRFGYGGQEFQYTGIDAWPKAQAMRKEIERQERHGEAPVFKRILTAAGVDFTSGEVWMALGDDLLHFDKDGNRRDSYHIYTPAGARLEANIILVDADHLIVGSDPLGIYEFERPDKKSAH